MKFNVRIRIGILDGICKNNHENFIKIWKYHGEI